jgi:hypothetical protein
MKHLEYHSDGGKPKYSETNQYQCNATSFTAYLIWCAARLKAGLRGDRASANHHGYREFESVATDADVLTTWEMSLSNKYQI